MISFKQLVKGIVVSILFILAFSILFNFIYVKQLVSEFNLMGKDIQDLNSIYIEMDLPVRVFKNISSQSKSDIEKDVERKNKIIRAYSDNRIKFKNEINEIYSKNINISNSLSAFSHNPFSNSIIPSHMFEVYTSNLNRYILALSHVSDVNLTEDFENFTKDTAILEQTYSNMRQDILKLTSSFNLASKLLVDKYILSINLLFIGLFIITILLTIILFKILNKDLRYILQGFHMINSHDYDETKLPNMKTIFKEEKEVENLITSVLNEQKFLSEVKTVTSSGYIIDDVLEDLFHSIQTTLKTDRVGIAFVDYYNNKIIADQGILNYGTIKLGPGFEADMESTTLSTLIDTKKPVINNDLEAEFNLRPDSISLMHLMQEGIQSNMIFPLIMNNNVFAFLFFSSRNKNNYTENHLNIGQNIAYEISALLDKTFLTKTIFSKITNTFSVLVDKKDNETGGHINRMVQYSTMLAKALVSHSDEAYRVDSRFIRDIENNASVHDIGKVGIPDEILKKPGKLTPEEWEIMKTHSTIGGDIFAELKESLKIFNRDFYKLSEDIARHHHEKWDGSGYPSGLKGQAIPLSARIVAIADVFDALTSRRVYKNAFGFEESVEIINQSAGSHLDPELVRVFNEILPELKKFYEQSHSIIE